MTVCIAAICDDGKKVVVAADRMFTTSGINVEFETDEQKIERLATNCVALSSGNSSFATEVLDAARRHLNNNQSPWIADVARAVSEQYAWTRYRKIDETIVSAALGMDFARFRESGGTLPDYLAKQGPMFQNLAMMAQQYNLGVDLILAGIDSSGAHISQVLNPGTLVKLEKLGYSTIGSGAIHAMTKLSLGAQTRHRSLHETVYGVYEAKKASEAAPGVGDATDLAVIDAQRGIIPCDGSMMSALENLHKETSKLQTINFGPLRELCDAQCNAK